MAEKMAVEVDLTLVNAGVVHPEVLFTWIWLRWMNPHTDGTAVPLKIKELAELSGLKVPRVSKNVAWLANRFYIQKEKIDGVLCYSMPKDLPGGFTSPVTRLIKKVFDTRRLKSLK